VIPERFLPLVERAEPVAKHFASRGFDLYLVGGVVRDGLVNRLGDIADLDYTTNARPDDIEACVRTFADAVWTQGKRFGTIGFLVGDVRHEVTTFRAEAYSPDSRKPEVEFADAIDADLSRRDFTVNAMALRLPDFELVDPFGGVADLAASVLRTPLDPSTSFTDDPLRMLRAARFIAGYGLVPVAELVEAVTELKDRLSIVSAERIRDEFDKLIVVEDCSPGLWFLIDTGLADEFLPELSNLRMTQDPIHQHKDVLEHTIAVVNNCEPERILRLSALYHDVAKPRTRDFGPKGVTFHHHEVVGARMTKDRMRKLKYSNDDVADVSKLVELHLRFHTYKMGWTDSAIRRYVRDAGDQLSRLNKLTRADCTTRNLRKAKELSLRMDELEVKIAELQAREEIEALRPELDGLQVIEHLGLTPGRVVGDAIDFLFEIRLDEGLLGDEEIRRRLDSWWAENQHRYNA
jgi:poly(A) polymerase